MHVPPRSIRLAASGGVRHRSRHRIIGGAQPSAQTFARRIVVCRTGRSSSDGSSDGRSGNVGLGRPTPARLLPDRSPSSHRRTVVRAAHPRGVRPGHGGSEATAAPHGRLVRLVIAYQRAMQGRPSPCRFTPTCSSYAVEALHLHGTLRGLLLTLRRLFRCRPFGPSGWDPVPPPSSQLHRPSSRGRVTSRKHATAS